MTISNLDEVLTRIVLTLNTLLENTERLEKISIKQSATARVQLAIAQQNLEAVRYGAPTLIQELATVSQQIAALGDVARSFEDAISQLDSEPGAVIPGRLRHRQKFKRGGLMGQIRNLRE